MRIFTNIPVSLCEYALVNQKINPLKLYIYLKLSSDGYVINDKRKYGIWAEIIGLTEKTVKYSLKWLISNKWITVNGKRNVLKVVSYNKLNFSIQIGYPFEFKSEREFEKFDSLCCGIVSTYYFRKRVHLLTRSERIKEGSYTNRGQKGFYSMPISYLAKCLNVSKSTACRYMRKAHKTGNIDIQSNLQFLETDSGKRITNEKYSLLVSECAKNDLPNKYRKGKLYIKQVEANLIRSNILLKRKKLKRI